LVRFSSVPEERYCGAEQDVDEIVAQTRSCEHVVDAAAARAEQLLSRAPNVHVMATRFTNNGRTTVWGGGTAGTAKVSDSMTLLLGTTVSSYTINGRISALQDLSPGTYSDTITVTLNYN
jgi:spore coat protein U-like protein